MIVLRSILNILEIQTLAERSFEIEIYYLGKASYWKSLSLSQDSSLRWNFGVFLLLFVG